MIPVSLCAKTLRDPARGDAEKIKAGAAVLSRRRETKLRVGYDLGMRAVVIGSAKLQKKFDIGAQEDYKKNRTAAAL